MEIKQHKLKYAEYDEERYSKFIQEQANQLLKRGFDEESAASAARDIAAMYRHHFRVWK